MGVVAAMTALTGAALAREGQPQHPPDGFLEGEFLSRGVPMPVLLVPPTAEGPLTGAAIMMLHGSGGLGSDLPTFRGPAMRWAALGCVVVLPVYFSEARRAPATDPVEWWSRAVGDAAEWMRGLPGIDPERLGVIGFSRGGYLAVEVAVQESSVKAAVGVASAGNVSPDNIVRKPDVLLIHASADPVVTPLRTRRWARVLQESGVPVEVVTVSSPRHNFNEAEWTRIFAASENFFIRTLGAPALAPLAPTLR